MAQTILTVVAEVQPASADLLRCRIKSLRAREEEAREEETRIK
jgi:hypothetical protein